MPKSWFVKGSASVLYIDLEILYGETVLETSLKMNNKKGADDHA
jgi:hypothetical protein